MAGNGTIGLELVEELPDVDAVLVPVGRRRALHRDRERAARRSRPRRGVYAVAARDGRGRRAALAAGRAARGGRATRRRSSTAPAPRACCRRCGSGRGRCSRAPGRLARRDRRRRPAARGAGARRRRGRRRARGRGRARRAASRAEARLHRLRREHRRRSGWRRSSAARRPPSRPACRTPRVAEPERPDRVRVDERLLQHLRGAPPSAGGRTACARTSRSSKRASDRRPERLEAVEAEMLRPPLVAAAPRARPAPHPARPLRARGLAVEPVERRLVDEIPAELVEHEGAAGLEQLRRPGRARDRGRGCGGASTTGDDRVVRARPTCSRSSSRMRRKLSPSGASGSIPSTS